jgi:DHA2 family multidrug resistance protein
MPTGRMTSFRQGLVEQFPRLQPIHPTYKWLVLAGVMLATFMAVLDATIVNVALSKLMSSFGVPVDRVEWVLTAYLLIFSVMLPSSGWLADHLGYKFIFMAGLALFTLGSFLCSLAWDFNILIAFRVVQGAGAGILMPVGMAIIMREFPPEKRGIALGFWTVAASASVSLGPTLGGYLIDNYSWHSIFDVNVPIGMAGLVALAIILREYKSADIRKFDIIGFLSLGLFLVCLQLALANGNSAWNTGGWTSSYIMTLFGLSALGMLIFLVTEFTVKHPLIELGLFRNFNFSVSNLAMFIFGVGMFGSIFMLPIYLQNSLGYTPFQAGLVFLPMGIMQGLSAPLAGVFSDRFNPKIPTILGLALMSYAFYEYGFLSYLSEKSQIMPPLYIRGIAMGLLFAPLTTMAISEITNRKMAQASGLLNVIRQIGGSLGVALFGSLLTRETIIKADLYSRQVDAGSAVYKQTIMHLQHAAVARTGGTLASGLVKAKAEIVAFIQKQAFISGVNYVYVIAAVVVAISAVPVLFIRWRRRREAQGRAAVEG